MLRIQMITMRLKAGPAVSSEWKCLFCLHVRTATIILGVWHVILHAMVLSALSVILRNRNLLHEPRITDDLSDGNNIFGDGINENEGLPTPLSKIDPSFPAPHTRDHGLYYTDLDLAALVTMCTLSFTLLLVYGAIKGRATHLLPFFCLQLFDFAVSTLTATGYACYMRNMHRLVAETWELPFRNYLLQLSPQCLSLVVLFAFIISMLIKAYCINIVWRCYKYLTLRQQALRSAIHYIMPGDMPTDRCPPIEPDYSSLLPDYEAACKQTPPPSYQAAVAAVVPPTESDATTVPSPSTVVAASPVNAAETLTRAPSPVAVASFAGQTTTITIPQTINTSANNSVTAAVAPVDQQPK